MSISGGVFFSYNSLVGLSNIQCESLSQAKHNEIGKYFGQIKEDFAR